MMFKRFAMAMVITIAGCQGGTLNLTHDDDTAATATTGPITTPDPPADPAVQVTATEAFDPIRGAPLWITARADDDAQNLDLVLLDASGAVVARAEPGETEASLGWNGRLADDSWAPAGPYTWQATRHGDGGELVERGQVNLVRCGVEAVYVEGDGGVTASRIALYYNGPGVLQDLADPISWVDSIEDTEGYPIELPEVSDNLTTPINGSAQPFAATWDSRPIVSLVIGDSLAFDGTGLQGVDIDVAVEGYTVLSGTPIAPGQAVTLQADEPLSPEVGVYDFHLDVAFMDPDGVPLASQSVPMRAYAMLAPPTFDQDGDRYAPWLAAIDPALRALHGTPAEHDAVVDELVRWIFDDLGLEYDTNWGASAYTAYPGGWEDGTFNMSSFLTRQFGNVVNCSDCAGILTNYSNMLGASLAYVIILPSFELNYILAIGGADFTSCPFGGGGCGFSYHAVTTDDGGETIWDATLAIDGDGDPGSLPATEQLVQTLDGEAYLDAIVRAGNPGYFSESKGELQ